MNQRPSERLIVFLVGAVQFVNIVDFMMVMPMGPDFAKSLGIPTSQLGLIGGAYTLAGAVAGVAGSFFLDRFDRRKALAVSMLGLVVGTAAGGFATNLVTLMAARMLAGVFGGPATSLSFSIIADEIPAERRGKAMGAVMGAFSAASVLGVPAGLKLAQLGGWRAPFFTLAGIGVVVVLTAISFLPPLTRHLALHSGPKDDVTFFDLVARPTVALSYAMTFVVMFAGFILIPNMSAYVQQNLGYPRDDLPLLYLCGGFASFFVMRLVGLLVDRYGSFRVATFASAWLVGIVYAFFIGYQPWMPVLAVFVVMMTGMSTRNVAYNTLTSKVPSPRERARFMSFQSAVQHLASALGAFTSSRMLSEEGGRLVGVPSIAWISIAFTASLPAMLWLVESRVVAAAAGPSPAPTLAAGAEP